jgi:serine/threonine-protein kinase
VLRDAGCMRWVRAADIGAQMADALCAAQLQGIVHRDLKPENVILQPLPDGTELVKLLDFGIAKHARDSLAPPPMQSTQAVTRVGMVVGTMGYMAPEQAVGKRADHRSDLYSLGVMLWECVVGERLWGNEDVQALLADQLNRPPATVRAASGDASIPDEFDRMVASLLETNPAERPQNPAEVRDTLRGLAADVRRGRLRSDEPSLVRRAPRMIASQANTRVERGGRERRELVDTAPQSAAPPTIVAVPKAPAVPVIALPPVALPRPLVVPPPAAGGVVIPASAPRPEPLRPSLWPRSRRSTWSMVAVTIGIVMATWFVRGALVPSTPAPKPVAAPQAEQVRAMLKSLVDGATREERVTAADAILKHVPVDEVPAYGRAMAHLQLAETCAQKKEQLDKIALVNDPSTLPVLITLAERKPTGCGPKGREDCLACLRADLDALIKRLETLQLSK